MDICIVFLIHLGRIYITNACMYFKMHAYYLKCLYSKLSESFDC